MLEKNKAISSTGLKNLQGDNILTLYMSNSIAVKYIFIQGGYFHEITLYNMRTVIYPLNTKQSYRHNMDSN